MTTSTAKPVIILGAGGHAKVVADALLQSGRNIIGFTSPEGIPDIGFFGIKVLGDDDMIDAYSPENIELANGVGALPNSKRRWVLATKIRKKNYKFCNVTHPSAIIASDVILLEGVQIMAGVVIQNNTNVGQDCIINTGVCIDHDCNIGNNCHLSPGAILCGGVNVNSGAYIGAGATVIQNISIGTNSIVAAGSVIYKNLQDGVTYI